MTTDASGRRAGKAVLCRWALVGMALILPACGDAGRDQVGQDPVNRDPVNRDQVNRDDVSHTRTAAGVREIVNRSGEVALGAESTVRAPEEVLDLYRERSHQPLWVHDGGLNRAGAELLELLRSSHEEGLPADRYQVGLLDAMVEDSGLEVALTSMVLRYATDLVRGYRDAADAEVVWLIPRSEPPGRDFLHRLDQGEPPARLLQELRPGSPQYSRLVASLRHYRQVEEAGGWPAFSDDVSLEEGDEGEDVLLLRRRLLAEGDAEERALAEPESAARPERFDSRLREAVQHFQARFALEADGVIGGRTLEELNTPLSQRLVDLETNLERWRWLPRDLGPRHILVNVAGYEMELVNEGRRVLSMDVVVGEEGWETPVFADTLEHIVFNPYWNVPVSIAESSLLPQIQSDPSYLERNNFEVVDRAGSSPRVVNPASIDWSGIAAEDFPYSLRQRPGPHNALGLVKFMFPNEYNIYLHDSPAEFLFSEPRRAYSHGCVRLEKPFELARLLLEIDSDSSDEEIEGFLGQEGERHVNLRGSVPIYIVYLTAWVDDDGTTRFHHDPYHNDPLEDDRPQVR